MLSHAARLFYLLVKCFRMQRRRFTPLQGAFARCAAILPLCKILSHATPPFYILAKCFRTLRYRFACQCSFFSRNH